MTRIVVPGPPARHQRILAALAQVLQIPTLYREDISGPPLLFLSYRELTHQPTVAILGQKVSRVNPDRWG